MTGITALVWGRRNQLMNVIGEVYSSLVLELYYDVGNDRRIDLNAQKFFSAHNSHAVLCNHRRLSIEMTVRCLRTLIIMYIQQDVFVKVKR